MWNLFKVNNKTPEQLPKRSHILKQTCSWKLQVCLSMCDLLERHSDAFIVNFIQISHIILVFPLLVLRRQWTKFQKPQWWISILMIVRNSQDNLEKKVELKSYYILFIYLFYLIRHLQSIKRIVHRLIYID